MIRLSTTEATLVDELLDCIAEALDRAEGVSPAYANKTKLQKLLYFAIEEYDLPITYSWYLAGAIVPDTTISPSSLPSPDAPASPSSPGVAANDTVDDWDDVPDESAVDTEDAVDDTAAESQPPAVDPIMFSTDVGPQTDDDVTSVFEVVSRPTLVDFYTNVVPDVWSQNTMRFLQNFYHEAAPPVYRSLYIESTHLRTHLTEIIDTVDARRAGEEPVQSVAELEPQLGRTISDLHYYLRGTDELRETLPIVTRGTDLIEDAVATLVALDPSEYTDAHVSALEQLKEFFYYHVWRYPCLRISARTATGPSADELDRDHRELYERFPEQFEDAYAESATAVQAAGLYPDPLAAGRDLDDDIARKLTDLSTEYLN